MYKKNAKVHMYMSNENKIRLLIDKGLYIIRGISL